MTGVVAVAPNTRVVVLTGSSDAEELTRAVHAGAHGLAVKGDDIERVVDTLERVHEGEIVLKVPQRPNSLLRAPDAPMERNPLTRFLTAREREVLERLVRGESTSDLAVAMGVRYSTARTHIQPADQARRPLEARGGRLRRLQPGRRGQPPRGSEVVGVTRCRGGLLDGH